MLIGYEPVVTSCGLTNSMRGHKKPSLKLVYLIITMRPIHPTLHLRTTVKTLDLTVEYAFQLEAYI